MFSREVLRCYFVVLSHLCANQGKKTRCILGFLNNFYDKNCITFITVKVISSFLIIILKLYIPVYYIKQ